MTTSIAPIARATAAEACTQELRERILRGAFPAGAKLPPERTLAADFGVNRVTVRAALSTLAAEKLVQIRQGSGAVVADFLESGGPGLIAQVVALAAGAKARAAVADLLAVRRALARIVMERVVDRIDDAGRGRIKSAVQSFARVVDERPAVSAVAAADLAVMRAIVAESGSPVLQLCLNPVAGVLASLPQLCEAMFAAPEASLAGYQALLGALEQPSTAIAGMMVDVLAAHDEETLARLEHWRKR